MVGSDVIVFLTQQVRRDVDHVRLRLVNSLWIIETRAVW